MHQVKKKQQRILVQLNHQSRTLLNKDISGRQKQNHHQQSLFNRISKECTSKTPEAISEMHNAVPRESKQGSC